MNKVEELLTQIVKKEDGIKKRRVEKIFSAAYE